MKKILPIVLILLLSGCSYDTAPKDCLSSGYKGILISEVDGIFTGDSCSDGEIVEIGIRLNSDEDSNKFYKSEDGLLRYSYYRYFEIKNNK